MHNKLLVSLLLLLALTGQAPAEDRPTSGTSAGALSFLKGLRSSNADEPLDPEKAFVIQVAASGQDALSVRFQIDSCCYLYRDKIRLELVPDTAGAKLGAYQLPTGKAKVDEFLGPMQVYDKSFDVRVPVAGLAQARAAALKVSYQGCAETPVAVCYAPTTKTFALSEILAGGSLTGQTSDGSPTGGALEQQTFIAYLAGALGFGLLLTFTPCVLPMVPILSSVIVGSGDKNLTKLEGGLLSYSYVLGTAVTYTAAGALAGASGSQLQAYFQNPWAIGLFTAMLVLLALSMFGFYKLEVPSAIQSFLHHHSHRIHRRSRRLPGGTYLGVFVLGLFSALIIGACASPILLGVLGAAMTTRDPLLGGTVMFMLAHGQGVFLVALGVGAGFLLPRVGPWMEAVKHVSGALLIAVAIYLLGALPQVPVLLLWGTFFLVCGLYLGAAQRPAKAGGWAYLLRRGLGTALLVWGIAALLGGFAGNRDVAQPLARLSLANLGASAEPAGGSALPIERIKRADALEERLTQARAAGKPVLVDYYADWCTDCVRMEGTTFRDPQVQQALARFVTVKADVTDANDPETRALKKRFDVYAPPALVFIDAHGRERTELRSYGYRSAAELLALLRQL